MLTLVPTPIDSTSPLEPVAKAKLLAACEKGDIICVEEIKEGRRRWLRFGLPRETIEDFVLYNEHSYKDTVDSLIGQMQKGKNVFLMSDCGLPAFCDPGRLLVERCHQSGIRVSSTPFPNSIALAMALSGFPHDRFIFEGFIPVRDPERADAIKRIMQQKDVSIIMDTPYRFQKLLEEMNNANPMREIFVGIELNEEEEVLIRDQVKNIKVEKQKKEFVIVVGPKL